MKSNWRRKFLMQSFQPLVWSRPMLKYTASPFFSFWFPMKRSHSHIQAIKINATKTNEGCWIVILEGDLLSERIMNYSLLNAMITVLIWMKCLFKLIISEYFRRWRFWIRPTKNRSGLSHHRIPWVCVRGCTLLGHRWRNGHPRSFTSKTHVAFTMLCRTERDQLKNFKPKLVILPTSVYKSRISTLLLHVFVVFNTTQWKCESKRHL